MALIAHAVCPILPEKWGAAVTHCSNPYSDLPPRAFWRTGVTEPGIWGLRDIWQSRWQLGSGAGFATYGSCFAQHISKALVQRQLNWVNAEPAPARCPATLASAYNFGVFSARTGNIYSARHLLVLAEMATGTLDPSLPEFWQEEGRCYDSLRPAIEPNGFESREEALYSRISMLRSFARSIAQADVLIFTLGLTEGWESTETGLPYAICPGTVAGSFDAARHGFRNYKFAEIFADLERAFTLMRSLNADLRLLLTVSPVPLTATAAGEHVLVATSGSKSTLRAVAGELARSNSAVDYFPSYELITGAPTRAMFYEPNLRSVSSNGVDFVMGHFFAGLNLKGASKPKPSAPLDAEGLAQLEAEMVGDDLVCEERILEAYNHG